MKKMEPQFCIIAPTSYLDYTKASTTHLVLAHLVDKDKEYAEFYKRRAKVGDYIMMDNSAYELKEPYTPSKLMALARVCGAHAIVLPDYPFQPGKVTIDAAKEFIPQFKAEGFDTFFVPQSMKGDLNDWLDTYIWAASNPDIDIIGMSILGIPNALPNVNFAYARVVMSQMLIGNGIFNFDKHHHYLGLNAGPALEIPSLIRMKALDSIDSSGPVWAGILGHEYTKSSDSYQTVSKLKMPVMFDIARTKDNDTLARIQHNVDLTIELMDTEHTNTGSWYAEE